MFKFARMRNQLEVDGIRKIGVPLVAPAAEAVCAEEERSDSGCDRPRRQRVSTELDADPQAEDQENASCIVLRKVWECSGSARLPSFCRDAAGGIAVVATAVLPGFQFAFSISTAPGNRMLFSRWTW